MKEPNDLLEASTGQKRGPQAGFASCLSNSATRCLISADGDGVGIPEPNTNGAALGEALDGRPGSKSVARAAAAATLTFEHVSEAIQYRSLDRQICG